MPLRLRMALLVGALTLLLLSAAGVLFFQQFRRDMLTSVDDQLQRQADVWQHIVDDGGPDLDALRSTDESIQLVDADGTVRLASASAGDRPMIRPGQAALAAGRPIRLTVGQEAAARRVLATPLSLDPGGGGVLVLATSLQPVELTEHRVQLLGLAGGIPAVLLAALGSWLLAGAALRPVERMRRQAAAISTRDPVARLAVPPTRDELAALAGTFNALLDRLQVALTREREFVADAGHELRTPLTILSAELELATRPGRTPDQLTAALTAAQDETHRLIRLAEDLLLLAKGQHGEAFVHPTDCLLADLVVPALRGARALAQDRGIEVRTTGDLSVPVVIDVDRCREALDNLLENALRYTPAGGEVRVEASVVRPDGDGPEEVRLTVRDTGEGFAPDFLPHAFGRFQRSDSARSRHNGGTGLGLAIVRSIAVAHGGWVSAANHAEGGAMVTVALPRAGRPSGAQPAHPPPGSV